MAAENVPLLAIENVPLGQGDEPQSVWASARACYWPWSSFESVPVAVDLRLFFRGSREFQFSSEASPSLIQSVEQPLEHLKRRIALSVFDLAHIGNMQTGPQA